MTTNQQDSKIDKKTSIDEVINQQIQDIKENPKKTVLIFLWNILWYGLVIMIILYLVSYPYQCGFEGKNYPPTQFKTLQKVIDQTILIESLKGNITANPQPNCKYNINNYKNILRGTK